MKKIFALLVFSLLLTSCDDGDMDVESFDFGTAQTLACNLETNNFFLFKTSGNEALIIQLPQNTLKNQETEPDTPITLTIGGNIKVIYRLYASDITSATICSPIPASYPVVKDEWTAKEGGIISIVSNAVHPVNESTGANFITGYSHNITLKDITFDRGDNKTQVIDLISFGSYVTPSPRPIEFSNLVMNQCQDTNTLFKFSGLEVMQLDLDAETYTQLFQPSATGATPRTALITSQDQVTYRKYGITLNEDLICNNSAGIPQQAWYARNGVSNVSGIIEVNTQSNPGNNGWEHTVVFRRVIFANDANDLTFTYGNAYEFGKFITQ
jgi:hypothetical protein